MKPRQDLSCPSSFWTIVLTAVLCKLMESIVTQRLVYFFESKVSLQAIKNTFRGALYSDSAADLAAF